MTDEQARRFAVRREDRLTVICAVSWFHLAGLCHLRYP